MSKRHAYLFEHEVDESKPRKTVFDTVFTKRYDGEEMHIPFGDLPTDLEPTDILVYNSDPGFFSENNSWESHTNIIVQRPRKETDEEYSTRLKLSREFLEKTKARRLEVFLKLKAEFEPSDENNS